MNSDRWTATCSAFRIGAREEASNCARQALQETPESNSILRGIHNTNLRAIELDRREQTFQSLQTPIIPTAPDGAPLSLRLYVHRVALITAYNYALKVLNVPVSHAQQNDARSKGTDLRRCSIDILLNVLRNVAGFTIDVLLRLPEASFGTKGFEDVKHSSNPVSSSTEKRTGERNDIFDWVYKVSDTVQEIMSHIQALSEALSIDELTCLEGWGRSAADAFDIAAAAAITDKTDDDKLGVMEATAYASAAQALRVLARSTRPMGQCDDISSSDADLADARTIWLQGLSLADAGDEEAALECLLPTAKAVLESRPEERVENDDINNAREEVIYLTAVLLLRRGGPDMQESTKFARGCAERMFRTADSLALVARAETGKAEDVERWAIALSVDGSPRPAGLWLTSRAFGRIGKYDRQAEILELAEDVLVEDETGDEESNDMQDDDELERRDGIVRLTERNVIQGLSRNSENVRGCLEMESLKAERGRALCAAGMVEQGKALLQSSGVSLVSGPFSGAQLAVECALADRAMTKEEADKSSPIEEMHNLTNWERVGVLIARAERMLRGGLISKARRTVEEAMRTELQVNIEDSGYEAFLRGICYGNMAVVRVCDGDVAGADEWFAAAQTALDKAIEEDTIQDQRSGFARVASSQSVLDREGLRLSTLATLGRCLAMAMCGRRSDAAGHWIAKRELGGASAGRPNTEKPSRSGGEPETNGSFVSTEKQSGFSVETKEPSVSGGEAPPIVTTVAKDTLLNMDKACLEIARH